jgi:hypothetical protein
MHISKTVFQRTKTRNLKQCTESRGAYLAFTNQVLAYCKSPHPQVHKCNMENAPCNTQMPLLKHISQDISRVASHLPLSELITSLPNHFKMDQGFSASPHLSFAETQAFVDSWNQTMNPAPLPVQNQLYLRPLPEQHHGYNTPPLSDPGASSLPMGPPGGAGNPQSCTLNLVVRAEHMENNSQR